MTSHTRLSADGRVTIPADVRARLGWAPDTEVELVEQAGSLTLRAVAVARERLSWEEFRRRVPPHDGPSVSIEQMDRAVDEMFAREWKR